MSQDSESAVDAALIGERRHLLSLAFRMLGTVAEAEDAVQETYVRWYRMDQAERNQVQVPRAWLTRVAQPDLPRYARHGGPGGNATWVPGFPSPSPPRRLPRPGPDPLDRVTLDDSVSTALLVVLEAMTPAERVAFVLHDLFAVPFPEIAQIVGRTPAACRQLAVSARARVRKAPARTVPRDEHDRVVRAFAAANRSGDLQELIAVLDPGVVLTSDGGGRITAARNPVYGADRVARFLLGALRKRPGVEALEQDTSDGLGLVMWYQGRIVGVVTLEALAGRITNVRMVLNPEKLSLWN